MELNFDEEIFDVISRGHEIVDYFTSEEASKRCPIIFHELKSAVIEGSGVQGKIYLINLTVHGKKKDYIVKKTKNENYELQKHTVPKSGTDKTLGELAKTYNEGSDDNVPDSLMFAINGGNKDTIPRPGQTVYTIEKKSGRTKCKMNRKLVTEQFYKRLNVEIFTQTNFTYPEGSYLCYSDSYPEYINGMLCSSLVSSGKCLNFVEIIGFSTCTQPRKISVKPKSDNRDPHIYDYTFMEYINGGTVYDNIPNYYNAHQKNDEIINGIAIQGLFAISAMQRIFGIQHNDLHTNNVMFQDVSSNPKYTIYDYFSYELDGHSIYIPNTGVIIKIIDFGYAMKYSSPIVGRIDIAKSKLLRVPGWRDDSYDALSFMHGMFLRFNNNVFLNALFSYMLDPFDTINIENKKISNAQSLYIYNQLKTLYFQDDGFRPNYAGLYEKPWEYIDSHKYYMKKYYIKPASDKILSLGNLLSSDFYPNYKKKSKPLNLFDKRDIRHVLPQLDALGQIKETITIETYNNVYQSIEKLTKNVVDKISKNEDVEADIIEFRASILNSRDVHQAIFSGSLRSRSLLSRVVCLIDFAISKDVKLSNRVLAFYNSLNSKL